jgi:hypothetical protein
MLQIKLPVLITKEIRGWCRRTINTQGIFSGTYCEKKGGSVETDPP